MRQRRMYRAVKRSIDILGSAAGICLTLPVWAVTVIGIELSDPGPVFYKAKRVGKGGCVFAMYKFRSMRVARDADEKSFKADTSRIFAFGELIRRLKIDELPQLINILKGDMSLVGPRPAAVDQAKRVRSGRNRIVSYVKPGLTGPSALYDYIYGDTIEDEAEYEEKVLPDRLELDVSYIYNRSLRYDLKMIWDTVLCIFHTIAHQSSDAMLEELRETAAKSRKRPVRRRRGSISVRDTEK